MGLFNANAPLRSDLNLLFQLALLVLLIAGVILAKLRRKVINHGKLMSIVMVLNTVSILVVMLPSFFGFRGLFSQPFTRPALVVGAHAVTGTLVEIVGIWIAGSWMFKSQDIKNCVKKRNLMRATFLFLIVELFIGVYVYLMLYVPI